MPLDIYGSLCSNKPGGKPLNAVHCIILQNQPPGVAAPSTGAFSLSVGIGTIFGCVSPHSLAGACPQTRPGWGMEPAPERKGVGGAGKQQGGKAEQIRATRYHVTQTEGGEISREQRAEPIAESRALEPPVFWCAICPPECRFSSCAIFYCGLYDTKQARRVKKREQGTHKGYT